MQRWRNLPIVMMADDTSQEIQALVVDHNVRYEVWSEFALMSGKKVLAGYEIELSGEADCESHEGAPGCKRCDWTYALLQRTAMHAGVRPADIEPNDASWHSTPKDGPKRRVVLTIRLTRYSGSEESPESAEQEQLVAIERSLTALGVRRSR